MVEGTSLENWHRVTPYRGFESHSLRHFKSLSYKAFLFNFISTRKKDNQFVLSIRTSTNSA